MSENTMGDNANTCTLISEAELSVQIQINPIRDPFLDAYLDDFQAKLNELEATDQRGHASLAMALCELSRDIYLRASPIASVAEDQVRAAISILKKACFSIRSSENDTQVEVYRQNIASRATLLEENSSLS